MNVNVQYWQKVKSAVRTRLEIIYARFMLRKKVDVKSPDYQEYLDAQLKRTLSKKNESPDDVRLHTRLLVGELSKLVNLSVSEVLCVGCRDHFELDHFYSLGVKNLVGIDLQSARKDIIIMDMHQLNFNDDAFDVIYSSHSLEHAYNPQQVISEFIRVVRPGGVIAVEVPVRYTVRGSDLVDFVSLENLIFHFSPFIEKVLWQEDQLAGTDRNDQGTPIVRVILQVRKRNE